MTLFRITKNQLPPLPSDCLATAGWRYNISHYTLPKPDAPPIMIWQLETDTFVDIAVLYDIDQRPPQATHLIELHPTRYVAYAVHTAEGDSVTDHMTEMRPCIAYYGILEKSNDENLSSATRLSMANVTLLDDTPVQKRVQPTTTTDTDSENE